jgi:hypothetical protein
MVSYATVGDIANVCCFLVNAVYLIVVLMTHWREVPFLDQEWVKNGFCVSLPDEPFLQSHAMCFYFDTVNCFACLFIYCKLRDGFKERVPNRNPNNMVFYQSVAIGCHGLGHALIAFYREIPDLKGPIANIAGFCILGPVSTYANGLFLFGPATLPTVCSLSIICMRSSTFSC